MHNGMNKVWGQTQLKPGEHVRKGNSSIGRASLWHECPALSLLDEGNEDSLLSGSLGQRLVRENLFVFLRTNTWPKLHYFLVV